MIRFRSGKLERTMNIKRTDAETDAECQIFYGNTNQSRLHNGLLKRCSKLINAM